MPGREPDARVSLDILRSLVEEKLRARGFNNPELSCFTDDCVTATAEGHVAHGVGALYVLDHLRALTPGSGPIEVQGSAASGIRVNAPTYLGYLPCRVAVDRLLESTSPIAHAVIVSRGHRGRIGHIARALADAGRIALVCQGTEPAVRIDDSPAPGVGTNPLAIALPIKGDSPIVVDIGAAGVSFARSFLACGPDAFEGLALKSDGAARARLALAIGVQGLAAALAGIGPQEPKLWSTVILCLSLPPELMLTREHAEHWTRDIGWSYLPGQRSWSTLHVARQRGVSVPESLLRWLKAP
jgi:LDH2 family malate/lactate/ureidoglycolate dehydrogenase